MRYLIGQETDGSPVYRICQINSKELIGLLFGRFINGFVDLAPDFVKPYKVNDKTMNQAFELRHGRSLKVFMMDKVSNGPFLEVKQYFGNPMFGITHCFNIERV